MLNKSQTHGQLHKLLTHLILVIILTVSMLGISKIMIASAITTLSPGDVYIVSVNSDYSYPGGANSNGFDFVSRVDLDPGTEIYFTDKGWDGSLGTPFWRNTSGEGALRYTVPAGGVTSGTIIHYDDTMIPTLPSSGSGLWDMYSIDPITGVLTLSTSPASIFDPSATGDNILVFQGSAATPTFIYGIGWSAATTWINSGTPTANNSHIPSGISVAGGTVTNLGTTDNYQYNCGVSGMFASTFAADIQNISNWNSDNTTPYALSSCIFDASRPQPTITQVGGQNDPTNNNSISFYVTFDQAIDPSSFTISDITLSGTGSGVISSLTTSDNITWIVNVNAGAEGTIIISLPNNSVTAPNGNPNPTTIDTDNSVLYDTTPPVALAAPDLMPSSDSGSSNSDNVTNDTTPEFTGICTNGDTIVIYVDGSPITPTTLCSGGMYSITPSSAISEGAHSITVTATDLAGNQSAVSNPLSITIDTIVPSCDIYTNDSFDVSPEINGFTDDTSAITSITIDGNTYTASVVGNYWIVAGGTIFPNLTVGQTYPLNVECVDIAGNTSSNSPESLTIKRHIDISLNVELITQGLINSGNTVTYRATLKNLDMSYSYNADNTSFYALVPVNLNAPVTFGQTFPVSNGDIECTNLSMTSDLDSMWHQYQNSYVVVCGFTSITNINPGESVSFDISFTAGNNLSDGTTLRMLLFDESRIDPDSDVINDEAENGTDFYSLNINNISNAVYRVSSTNPETEAAKPKQTSTPLLATTGINQANYTYIAITMVLICLIVSSRRLSPNRE